jgi:GGDEF domain-containing protein
MSEDPKVKELQERILALEGALENSQAMYRVVEQDNIKIATQRDQAIKGVSNLSSRIQSMEKEQHVVQLELEFERIRTGSLQEALSKTQGQLDFDSGLIRLLHGIDDERAPHEPHYTPGVVKLEQYELEEQLEHSPDVREKFLLLDQYASLELSPFMDEVSTHLGSNISIYSIMGDDFVRIYTSNKELKFEKVARSDGDVMSALVAQPPGIYRGTIMPERVRSGTQDYVGLHICPPIPQRRSSDVEQDPPRLIINICPKKGKALTPSDMTFLRMLQPLISNGMRMTQRIALQQRDEQGYIEDKERFYENVMDRIRRTGETGKRYGIVMTDLRDFEKFNKIAGQDVGDRVLNAMRAGIREVIRSDDIAALKNFAFSLKDGGGAYILSDETAQKDGDESCILASVDGLGELVVVGRRVQAVVESIDIYTILLDEEEVNKDFDANQAYQGLCEAAPYMLDDQGVYRCRLNVGVNMLEPPTDQELDDEIMLSGFAKRAVYHADMAMQHVKQMDKKGRGSAIGYRKLVVDPDFVESSYQQGNLGLDVVDAIRSAYRQISEWVEAGETSDAITREKALIKRFVEQELMNNLVPERRETLSLASTHRYPLNNMRSVTRHES